jgi:hypothetical protein
MSNRNPLRNLTVVQLNDRIDSCDRQMDPLIAKRREQSLNLAEIDTLADTAAEQYLYYTELRIRGIRGVQA